MNTKNIEKVSVVFAVHNRLWALENTLYSMNRQKTDIPVEFCIWDDCSDESAEPIVKKFLTNFEYKFGRSEEKLGVFQAVPAAFRLSSIKSNVVILTCSDVIWADENTINILCEGVDNKKFSFADVINTPIFPDFWKEFEINLNDIICHWNDYKNYYWSVTLKSEYNSKVISGCWNLFSGKERDSWLFYLGAIMKKDLLFTGVQNHWCDAILDQKTRKVRVTEGWDAVYPGVKAIHQRHNKGIHICSEVEKCKFDCVKKQEKWIN
ncbi:glycosyltransferase [Candidatus Pacearchaeota archaeon]|jgi:hypothetical protein|nr:glycosyltransferase [Candidatus Pacearchaeota archaeon]